MADDDEDNGRRPQHVCVVGAGLVGLLSGHYLEKSGFRVTIVDRQDHPANEASYANAALLMRSYSRPKTMTPSQLVSWISSREHPVHVALRALADPDMIRFGLRFFLAGPQTREEVSKTTNVVDALAAESRTELDSLCKELSLQTPCDQNGLLIFFRKSETMAAAVAEATESFPEPEVAAGRFRVVSSQECLELEPSLEKIGKELVGGIFWHKDATMDALAFSNELSKSLKQRGASFEFGETLESAEEDGTLTLASGRSIKDVDALVIASGVQSGHLLSSVGDPASSISAPLYGMRGHSMTFDITESSALPPNDRLLNRSVCDGETMVFFSPLCNSDSTRYLRAAAFGDFDGFDYGPRAVKQWRMSQIMDAIHRIFPASFAQEASRIKPKEAAKGKLALGSSLCPADDPSTQWTGLRPMSPDGMPILGLAGKTRCGSIPIFMNAGHGALGWTLSAGSGILLADSVGKHFQNNRTASAHDALAALKPHFDSARFSWRNVLEKAYRMRRWVPR